MSSSPPYYDKPTGTTSPQYRVSQSPPLDYVDDTGTFRFILTNPQWIERGNTARFRVRSSHVKDGAMDITSLAVNILDQNGNTATGTTLGPITKDATGDWYSDITFGTSMSSGQYEVEWTGTYMPQGSSTPLNIRTRNRFRLKVTNKRTQYVFKRTDQF